MPVQLLNEVWVPLMEKVKALNAVGVEVASLSFEVPDLVKKYCQVLDNQYTNYY